MSWESESYPTATWKFAVTTKPTASTAAVVIDYLEKPLEALYVRRRSSYCELSLTVENRQDLHILNAAAYRCCLLGIRNNGVRFHGQIVEHEETERGFTVTAKDPYYNMSWRRFWEDLTYTSVGDAEIAMRLIEWADDDFPCFLKRGTIETGVNRTRSFKIGERISEKVEFMARLAGGFEFTIGGTYGEIGELARFNSFSPYDEEMPEARFEYGQDTLDTVQSYTRTVRPLINKANIVGDRNLVATAESVPGRADYGLWEDERGHVLTANEDTLLDIAQTYVQHVPKYALTLTPGPKAPQLFTDFDVIHKVPYLIKNFGEEKRGSKPVLQVALRLDPASGQERIEELVIDDPDDV